MDSVIDAGFQPINDCSDSKNTEKKTRKWKDFSWVFRGPVIVVICRNCHFRPEIKQQGQVHWRRLAKSTQHTVRVRPCQLLLSPCRERWHMPTAPCASNKGPLSCTALTIRWQPCASSPPPHSRSLRGLRGGSWCDSSIYAVNLIASHPCAVSSLDFSAIHNLIKVPFESSQIRSIELFCLKFQQKLHAPTEEQKMLPNKGGGSQNLPKVRCTLEHSDHSNVSPCRVAAGCAWHVGLMTSKHCVQNQGP